MYSQWDEDGDVDDASSGDDADYLTPSEGLSEVEEEPDESGAVANPTLDETNVEKGAVAGNGDVGKTGPGTSTIRRTMPKASETHVRRRIATAKHDAMTVDQAEVLPRDLDVCREALRLFLTSQIKEAEDLCIDKDPDGNHLYLISGHAIIQALKVSSAGQTHRYPLTAIGYDDFRRARPGGSPRNLQGYHHHCFRYSQVYRVDRLSPRRDRASRPRSGADQGDDSGRTTRGAGMGRDYVDEGYAGHHRWRRLAWSRQRGVSRDSPPKSTKYKADPVQASICARRTVSTRP